MLHCTVKFLRRFFRLFVDRAVGFLIRELARKHSHPMRCAQSRVRPLREEAAGRAKKMRVF
jgi:hypothetical protein